MPEFHGRASVLTRLDAHQFRRRHAVYHFNYSQKDSRYADRNRCHNCGNHCGVRDLRRDIGLGRFLLASWAENVTADDASRPAAQDRGGALVADRGPPTQVF
jgi:ribosomal protein S14